ncbi:MAG: PDZ domain-containing protein [Opitutales bacterium]
MFITFANNARAVENDSLEEAIQLSVKKVYPAIVRIHVVAENGSGGRMKKSRGSGSGVIISKQGHVVTNHHVAGKSTRLTCRLHDGQELEATLVGTDILSDLSVLRLRLDQRKGDKALPTAKFGDSDEVKVGDVVLAMGSPAGLSQSVTRGIASNLAMITPQRNSFRLDGENVGMLVRWIGHDAIIFPGNSGGPLVNLKGEIIGINEVGIGSLGGAIPGNLARKVAQQLIESGIVKRSWVGVEAQPLLEEQREGKGVLVAGVISGSPAEEAGLVAGDVIQRFDGVKVNALIPEDLPLFNRIALGTPIGKEVQIHGLRNGKKQNWSLTTSIREAARMPERELKNWGITARNFSMLSALEARRPDVKGIQVHSVRSGSPADSAKPGLRPGDVIIELNGKPVTNLDELVSETKALVSEKEEAVPTLVSFERSLAHLLTVVKLGPERERNNPLQAWKPWLGVATQVLTRDLSAALEIARTRGVRVIQVYPDTPAAKAEFLPGDILLKMDGQIIQASREEDAEVFGNMLREYKIGATVVFSILRQGEPMELTVKLERRPTPANELDEYKDRDFEFKVRELSFGDRVSLRLGKQAQGLMVENVEAAGWASLAGLRQGDVILKVDGKPINAITEFRKRMEAIAEERPERVIFFIKRRIHTMFVEFEPNWENP